MKQSSKPPCSQETSLSRTDVPSGASVLDRETKIRLEKRGFLWGTRTILSQAYRSGFMPSIREEVLASMEGDEKDEESVYSRSEARYQEVLEQIDIEWEIELLDLAYDIACESHSGVVRASGEPYVTHPIGTAKIVLEDFPSPTAFKAIIALLHDVIEDAKDRDAKRAELLARFRAKAEERRPAIMAQMLAKGLSHSTAEKATDERIVFLTAFVKSIVEAVDLLSKDDKESYLFEWERPLLVLEDVMAKATAIFAPLLWGSPMVSPPRIIRARMEHRADVEYQARFEMVLANRVMIAVLCAKIADRIHNLRNPKPSKKDPSKPDLVALQKILEETDRYLDLAQRLDPQIYELLKEESDSWWKYLFQARAEEVSRVTESIINLPVRSK